MKKVLLKIYLEPHTKRIIEKIAEVTQTSQSQTARDLINAYFESIVFPEDEKEGCSVWQKQ